MILSLLRPARVYAAALLLALTPASPGGSELTVRLQAPEREDLLSGRVVLRAQVTAPEGVAVVEVTFVADGAPLATVTQPPYQTVWSGFDTLRDHLLRVTVVADDGERAYDLVSVPAVGPVTRATVTARAPEFLMFNVTFVDGRGRPVVDVRPEDVRLFEAGKRREVEMFEPDTRPLAAELLLDASRSTQPYWSSLAASTALFARTMRPGDRAGIEAFQDRSYQIAAMGSPGGELEAAIAGFTDWGGGTRLYDSLCRAALYTLGPEETERRALILLTDGVDQVSELAETDALNYLLRAGVELHAVLFEARQATWRGRYEGDWEQTKRVRKLMEDLASATGGDIYNAEEIPMPEIFVRIGERLRAHYVLGYTSDDRRPTGRERKLEIRVAGRRGVRAHVRRGTFGGEELGDFLARQILEPPPARQIVAIRAAGLSDSPAAQRALVQILGTGERLEEGVAQEARLALLSRGAAAVPYLREALEDPRQQPRSAVVLVDLLVVLSRSGRPAELEAAVTALGDGDAAAGRRALSGLRDASLPGRTELLLEEVLDAIGPP